MNIIEKIDKLRMDRGWSVNRLAGEAMLTQSTLATMYKRKTPPKIEVLESICNALEISLAEFFREDEFNGRFDEADLHEDEKILLVNYRKLSQKQKNAINIILADIKK